MADNPNAPALRGGASSPWTVQRVLAWMTQDFAALSIPAPRLDAELLLCRALECDRVRLYMDMQRPLDARELEVVRALVVRRRRREPVAYILGRREFYRHSFEVTRDVLIPRPETEVLVDRALELLARGAARAVDLCTGSGAIAITLALERPELEVDATDISEAALTVAARNAGRLGVADRVHFHRGDLFVALPEPRRYALVVANPPYVADGEWNALAPEIRGHEPRGALLSGPEGLDVLTRLCASAATWLAPGGSLLFEVGQGQAPRVMALLSAQNRWDEVLAHKDLSAIERIVGARLRSE
jgi:release factor glutamine methyltransferase